VIVIDRRYPRSAPTVIERYAEADVGEDGIAQDTERPACQRHPLGPAEGDDVSFTRISPTDGPSAAVSGDQNAKAAVANRHCAADVRADAIALDDQPCAPEIDACKVARDQITCAGRGAPDHRATSITGALGADAAIAAESDGSCSIGANQIPLNYSRDRSVIKLYSNRARGDHVPGAGRRAADEIVRGVLAQHNPDTHGKVGRTGSIRADVIALHGGAAGAASAFTVDENSGVGGCYNDVSVRRSRAANHVAGSEMRLQWFNVNRASSAELGRAIRFNAKEVSHDGAVVGALDVDISAAPVPVVHNQALNRGAVTVAHVEIGIFQMESRVPGQT
jgi:hypothetical protein